MKSEVRDSEAASGPKENTNDHTNDIEVGSIGIGGGQDNGASTLRELKRKHAGKTSPSTKTRRPML